MPATWPSATPPRSSASTTPASGACSATIVDKAHAEADCSKVGRVGVDETSSRKGHLYVTCFVDLDANRLLHMAEGPDAATVESFAAHLPAHQGSPESIAEVAMDMSQAFRCGVAKHLLNAVEVFARFHVMALAGKALDEVRREVRREESGLEAGAMWAMWALRGNKDRLKAGQRELRERLCRQYSKLGRALSWREFLADTWRYATRDDAEERRAGVCSWGRRCRLQLCANIRRHCKGILDYYNHWTTSAAMEGLNSSLQLARKRAKGYRNWENFRTIAYWIAGAQSRNRPAQPALEALLNTTRFSEVPPFILGP